MNVEQKKNAENVDEVSNLSSMKSSGVLPVIPVTIGSGSKTLETFALCDSGESLFFVDESLMKALNLTEQPVDLNDAGIHGTSDISSKRLRVRIGDQDGKANEDIMVYSHHGVNAGNRLYDLKKLKETYPHLSVLKDSIINLKDVKSSWAMIVITCIELPYIEYVETQSPGQCERSWDGCSVNHCLDKRLQNLQLKV